MQRVATSMALFCGIVLVPHFVFAAVVINEIAWMGTAESHLCEWMELYNTGSDEVDLAGWGMYEQGGEILVISLTKKISPGGYYLVERFTPSCPDAVPGVAADDSEAFGGAGLNNLGEHLVLKDSQGEAVDGIDALGGWPAGDKDTKETMQRSGAGWITASPTPRAPNAGSSTPPPTPTPASPPLASPPPAPPPASAPPPAPSLRADAGPDVTALAGTIVTFRGIAYGLDGKPLDTARFLWNFGDGSTQEGKAVIHVYHFPGSYRVNLSVSSGEYAGSDWLTVTVAPPRLVVSEVGPGENGFVEIYNGSDQAVDLTGLLLTDNFQKIFRIPSRTIASAGGAVVIPNITSGLNPVSTLTISDARGVILDAAAFASRLPAGGSWERTEGGFVNSSAPTPGQYAATTPSKSQPVAVQETPAGNPAPPPAVPKVESGQPSAGAGIRPPVAAAHEPAAESVAAAAAANLSPRLFLAAGIVLSALAAAALVFLKRILP